MIEPTNASMHSGPFSLEQEKEDKAKIAFLNNLFILAGVITFGMGFVRLQESITLGLVDFGFCLFSAVMLYFIHNHQKQIELITSVSLALFFLLFITIYLLAPNNPTRVSLFFPLLSSAFFLKGRKAGFVWLAFIMVSITALHFVPFFDTGYSHVDILTANLFLIAQFAIHIHYENYKEDQRKRLQGQEALRLSEERWRLALEGAGDAIWDWDMQSNELQYSKRFLDMLGYSDDELENRYEMLLGKVHPEDLATFQESLAAYLNGASGQFVSEHRIRCKDNNWMWVLCRGMVTHRDADDRPVRMAGTHTDISEKKEADALIWTQANYDSLTLLPNRRLFRDRLDHELRKAQRDQHIVALMFIDLDHFKEINDTLGHHLGDQLLIEAGKRIQRCVRESDTVARLGGDEFTVILPDLGDFSDIERIARCLLQSLSDDFRLGLEQVYISASVGITVYPNDATDIEDLIKNADQALYAAKNGGRNRFHYFTTSMQETAQARMRLVTDIRHALAANEFMVYYQPVVDLESGKICKAEALLRWKHAKQGFISPATFIPIAEDTGAINELGDMVFMQAAMKTKYWQTTYDANFQVSINKSPVQFRSDGEGHNHWLEHLEAMGMKGSSIVVEITEGLLLHADAEITDKLLRFRDAGIQVAIDDFGTGYSSLSYLKKFDIDYLKIDQSFIQNLTLQSPDFALCEAIVVMAHKLGLKVIAEGVETEQQRDLLKNIGCDFAQGYLYSRPVPPEEFDALLRTWTVPDKPDPRQ
jgi:diguanylate cyclase (GGDEF)-like protein/PAS domain S-box-containing protein